MTNRHVTVPYLGVVTGLDFGLDGIRWKELIKQATGKNR